MMLQFKDIAKLKTKRVVFQDVFSARDSASLEQLKELSAKRRAIEESINETSFITDAIAREMSGGLTSRYQQDLQKLEQYFPLLENLIFHADSISNRQSINKWISDLKISWTSTLGSSSFLQFTGPKYFQIDSLQFELGMSLSLYGAIIRERAFELLSEDLVQSATLLRKAAGVYNYLAWEVLPSLKPMLPPEKPAEATTHVSSALSLICLAEAQSVTIKRAEENGSTGGLLAKLHYGVLQLLDEASVALQSVFRDCKDISLHFLDFISSYRALNEIRSYKYLAEGERHAGKVGICIGILRKALANAQKKLPGESSWRLILQRKLMTSQRC
ncbi:hypothetical protein Nepgr_003708 [Nepenthes gracilis]|uniref:BRO1 domain-containing protein n=1 Tax=Nepenthes gracilis TaxID=150966 RepID=A0AAD3S007_NEPGR|nr:hypothetical protein Nepgr_003708 [Nepenthes gracilis]